MEMGDSRATIAPYPFWSTPVLRTTMSLRDVARKVHLAPSFEDVNLRVRHTLEPYDTTAASMESRKYLKQKTLLLDGCIQPCSEGIC